MGKLIKLFRNFRLSRYNILKNKKENDLNRIFRLKKSVRTRIKVRINLWGGWSHRYMRDVHAKPIIHGYLLSRLLSTRSVYQSVYSLFRSGLSLFMDYAVQPAGRIVNLTGTGNLCQILRVCIHRYIDLLFRSCREDIVIGILTEIYV